MNQVFKWCILFRDLCLILTMFSGCCAWIPHYNGAWLAVCDTVTVLLGDIALLAFEKILVLFSGHRKTAFFTTAQISAYNCTKFFTTAQSVHNCTLTKPWNTQDDFSGQQDHGPWRFYFFLLPGRVVGPERKRQGLGPALSIASAATAKPARKQILARNSQSGSFNVIYFGVTGKGTRD